MNLEWNDEMISAFRKIIAMDESFKNISNQIGFPENRSTMEGFKSLAKIIIGQQISTHVAKKIYNQLNADDLLNETTLSRISTDKLKEYGLSSQKSFYIKNLATLINDNELDLKSLRQLESKDITRMLIKIKGIGEWTINNYKIFALQDIDAWPSADLALQEAVKLIKKLDKRPDRDEMEKIGTIWQPYRGAAALFLWHFYNQAKIKKRIITI